MDRSLLIERLKKTTNIYSFIVELYCFLDAVVEHSWKPLYSTFCSTKTDTLHLLRAATNAILYARNDDFRPWLNSWLSIFSHNESFSNAIIYQTLKNFDEIVPELIRQPRKTVICHGPLNDYSRQEGLLYITAPSPFLTKYFEKNAIRIGRQTVLYRNTWLATSLQHYFIVKKAEINKYLPVVHCYNKKIFNDDIIISCCPFSKDTWVHLENGTSDDFFRVGYDEVAESSHNKKITELIRTLDEFGANIVTFPELVLNNSSLSAIKSFLLQTRLQNVQLIITGSNWNTSDTNNTAYIISKDGTVLLNHQKKVPYKIYSKTAGKYITEELSPDEYVQFLDIPNLGRIAYNICADYNDDYLQFLCASILEANFYFIAAYSPDTYLMMEKAKENAARKGVTTIMTNSCAVANEDQAVSFIVKPFAQGKHLFADQVLIEKKNNCEDCSSTNCFHTGKIKNNT